MLIKDMTPFFTNETSPFEHFNISKVSEKFVNFNHNWIESNSIYELNTLL